MKALYVAALLAVGLANSVSQSRAQSAQFGPAYIGVIEAVVDGQRIPLERQTAVMNFKMKAFGMGGTETRYEIKGAKSSIRLRPGQDFFFVSRLPQGGADPQSMFQLSLMKANKKTRIIPQMKMGGLAWSGSVLDEKASQYKIPLVFSPFKKDFIKIRPATALAPGEYFMTPNLGFEGFAFGVD